MSYIARILRPPSRSFFLFGPRGCGKTTWLRHHFEDARFFDLLSERLYQEFLANPDAFAGQLRAVSPGQWVVVDEIQRIPALLNEVHRFMEERGLKFVLCGSSARKLKQSGVNLLAGRAVRRFMHPFLPEELGSRFLLEDTLQFGSLPIVAVQEGPQDKSDTLMAYARLYLKEEVQAEALVRNLPAFARFLPVAAVCHAQTINVSGLARDASVARSTVNGYIDILEDTLLCFRLPGYEARLRVKERKLPKLFWTDPGIVRAVRATLHAPTPEERGALFEGLVGQMLRAYRDYRGLFDEMFYWSPPSSAVEVDFLIKRGDEFVAVEVKSAGQFAEKWCRGLRALRRLPGLRRRIVVHPAGEVMRTEDGIDILPFSALADELAGGEFWPT